MNIRSNLSNNSLPKRLGWCFLFSFILFIFCTIASYHLLPEGLLRGKQSAGFTMSNHIFIGSVQIFLWNMISVIMIFTGSLFTKKTAEKESGYSLGYTVLFVLILLNAITLGTWSFSIETTAIPLLPRLLGMLDILHKGGLWEISGQILIACSLTSLSFLVITKGHMEISPIKNIRLNNKEIFFLLTGFILIYIGAFIESAAMHQL